MCVFTYRGTMVPLVTPVDGDGLVDTASVARLVESVRSDVTGLMPALSTGEGWKLTDAQWLQVVEATVANAGTLPVVAGVQVATTDEAVSRARLAVEVGAAAVIVPPPAGPVTADRLVRHYRRIVNEAGIETFVYHLAPAPGEEIPLAVLVMLCRVPGIVGVKESSGSAAYTRALLDVDPGVPVFQGWERLLEDPRDVDGFIGPLANLEPELCNQVLDQPSADLLRQVDARCDQYALAKDDWYAHVKFELFRRGVLSTPYPVHERER